MSIPRLSVREYVQDSEVILKIDDLTDVEMEAVQEMVDRVSEKMLTTASRKDVEQR